jgi:hypothetical protein
MTEQYEVVAALVGHWIVTSFVKKSGKLRVNIVDHEGHFHLQLDGADKIWDLATTLQSLVYDYENLEPEEKKDFNYGGTNGNKEPF